MLWFFYIESKLKIDIKTIFPSLVITIGWSRSSYVITEGEDSQIFVCADILHGTLQTLVIAPFININFTGTGMHNAINVFMN